MGRKTSCYLSGKAISANMEGIIMTDRICGGNYKFVDSAVLTDGFKVNEGVNMTVTHETGIKATVNVRVKVVGSANIEGLANIAVYCKFKEWSFETDGENFTIIGGKANKFHGITSMLKIVDIYGKADKITASVFDSTDNAYLGTVNLKNVDVVKTLQKTLDRGYFERLVTDRKDFII